MDIIRLEQDALFLEIQAFELIYNIKCYEDAVNEFIGMGISKNQLVPIYEQIEILYHEIKLIDIQIMQIHDSIELMDWI